MPSVFVFRWGVDKDSVLFTRMSSVSGRRFPGMPKFHKQFSEFLLHAWRVRRRWYRIWVQSRLRGTYLRPRTTNIRSLLLSNSTGRICMSSLMADMCSCAVWRHSGGWCSCNWHRVHVQQFIGAISMWICWLARALFLSMQERIWLLHLWSYRRLQWYDFSFWCTESNLGWH